MSYLSPRFIAFLRWTERYTKTDMVYLVTGGLWTAFGTVASLSVVTLTFLAFANLLPKESYGTYQYILAIADLFGIFVLSGIDSSISRSTAQGKDGSMIEGVLTKIRWGLVGGVGAIALGAYYLTHANSVLGWGFVIAGLFIPFWEAPGVYGNYLQGKKRFDLINIGDVIIQLCVAVVLIPALFLTDNILIILGLYMLSMLLSRTALFFYSLKKLPPNAEPDPEMIPYGKHLSVMSVISTLASNTDTVLLWHFLGPAPVATYIFSQSIPARANGILKNINRMAFPKMAAIDPARLKEVLIPKVWFMVGVSTLGALAYVVAAPFIFHFFLPQYIEAVPYTMLAAGLIVVQPFSLISSALTAQAKKHSLYLWSIGTPLIRIALFLVLIPLFGLWGAMGGLVLAKTGEALLLLFLFYRY
jgi:O-antigen/teichoic acid export membrane protein